MKRIFRISLCAFLLLAGAACTRHKIIPDEKLAQIFHDAFLTNAYIGDVRVNIDSLNIYEPIFARYGYTTRDVYYTIRELFEAQERPSGRRRRDGDR